MSNLPVQSNGSFMSIFSPPDIPFMRNDKFLTRKMHSWKLDDLVAISNKEVALAQNNQAKTRALGDSMIYVMSLSQRLQTELAELKSREDIARNLAEQARIKTWKLSIEAQRDQLEFDNHKSTL